MLQIRLIPKDRSTCTHLFPNNRARSNNCFVYSDILRRCIVEQVAKMMVLPNKLPIKLSDEIPTVDLRMPEPEVRMTFIQYTNKC